MHPYFDTQTALFELEERRCQALSHRLARSHKKSRLSKDGGDPGELVMYDPQTVLGRQRQEELRSSAAKTALARERRTGTRRLDRRPLYLRVVTRLFGPR